MFNFRSKSKPKFSANRTLGSQVVSIFLCVGSLCLHSCQKDESIDRRVPATKEEAPCPPAAIRLLEGTVKAGDFDTSGTNTDSSTYTYKSDIKDYVTAHCANACHSATATEAAQEPYFTSDTEISAKGEAIVLQIKIQHELNNAKTVQDKFNLWQLDGFRTTDTSSSNSITNELKCR